MQNPTTGGNNLAAQTAVKMQNNSTSNQNASTQAVPKPNVKPKFSCADCSFTCNSVLNFRIHLQTAHGKTSEEIQNATTIKPPVQETPKAAVNVPKVKAAVHVQTGAVPGSSGSNVAKIKGAVSGSSGSNVVKGKDGQPVTEKKKKKSGSKSGSSKDDPNKYKAFIIREPVLYGKKKGKSGSASGSGGRELIKLRDYVIRSEREPLIGLEYVLEYIFLSDTDEIETKYYCELCDFDTDVDPMVEHMASFGHRKLYLAKEFPYVLKAQSSSKEDPSKFIRRMALEIEKEEGTKKYKIDESIWMETMAAMKAEERRLKRKSRWDVDRNDATRMRKALTFLETFEVDNELEATTVTKLCEKLSANLESYKKKLQEEALFPGRVAKAQNVASSFMNNAPMQPTCFPRLSLMNPQRNIRPLIMKIPPTLPGNANLMNNPGMRFPRPNVPNMNDQHNMSNIPPNQQRPQYPIVPSNEKPAIEGPSVSKMTENPEKAEKSQSDDSFIKTLSQEDTQFFKKLKALLEVLPQNTSLSGNAQTNSKLMTLKSLMGNQKSVEHKQANQNLMERVTSMVQDTIGVQNSTVNQQLMMFMTSQNSSAMVMQTSLRNNSVQLNENLVIGGTGPGIQSSGNMQMSSLKPLFGKQGQVGETYQGQGEMRNYPSTSQNYDNSSYGKSVEPTVIPNTDLGYESRYGKHVKEPAPFTRVPLAPSSSLNRYVGYDNDSREVGVGDRQGLISYNTSEWNDPESDTRYIKRARMDVDNRTERSEGYSNRPLDSLGMNRAGMPQEILKRIQGKDLFTGK